MTDKVYGWERRESVRFTTPETSHEVYFFRKSFENCTGETVKVLMHGMIEAAEEKFGVVYSSELQSLINMSSVESVQDPLLKAIFGLQSHLDQATILEYYEKEAMLNETETMPFVDLCVVLGDWNRVEKFAKLTGKDFEILRIMEQIKVQPQSDALHNYAIQMWIEKAPMSQSAARLTSLIHRCAESGGGEAILRPLTELWGEGFYWDVLCLVAILFPNHPVFALMKENIPKFLKHQDDVLAALLKWAFSGATEGSISSAYDNAHLKHLDAISIYRLIKIDICRNERNTSCDIEKLVIRAKCSQALRFVFLLTLVQLGPLEARTMVEDAMEYVKTSFEKELPDYFPHIERVLFQNFFGMVADVYSVIIHVLQPNSTTSSTISIDKEKHDGLMNIIFAKWRRDYAKIWSPAAFWARSSFVSTCDSLLDHIYTLEKILESSGDFNTKVLKLSVRVCWMFARNDFNPDKAGIRCYMDVAEEMKFDRDHAHVFAHAFHSENHSETTSPAPNHLTGDEFILTIKQRGIQPPPAEISVPQVPIPIIGEEITKNSDEELVAKKKVREEKHEKEENDIQQGPHRVNPLFHPANTQLPAELEVGKAIPIVSEDGVFDEKIETVWEAQTAEGVTKDGKKQTRQIQQQAGAPLTQSRDQIPGVLDAICFPNHPKNAAGAKSNDDDAESVASSVSPVPILRRQSSFTIPTNSATPPAPKTKFSIGGFEEVAAGGSDFGTFEGHFGSLNGGNRPVGYVGYRGGTGPFAHTGNRGGNGGQRGGYRRGGGGYVPRNGVFH